jgi:CheY-like chemotaxis protein
MAEPTVLLVTDSEEERDLYASALPMYGFRVSSLTELAEVREVVDRLRPDLLVLNIRLGADSTWELLEQIQCGGTLQVPGVLVTGSVRPDAANRLRASATGCAAFVVTPCTPAALARILTSVLAGERGLTILRPEQFRPATPAPGGTRVPE